MVVDTSAPLRDIVEDYKGKNAEEMLADLNQIPFFMTEYKEGQEEDNVQLEALRALAYEGEPHEIAENFKDQGNDCFKAKKYLDASKFYTQALSQILDGHDDLQISCLNNRAQCNLELKNYRKCITDCSRVLDLDPANLKAWFRSAKAFMKLDKPDECIACCERGLLHDPAQSGLLQLKADAENRALVLRKREEERQKQEDLRLAKEKALENACYDPKYLRNLEFYASVHNKGDMSPSACKLTLEDPMDPSSTLYFPVLALYSLNLESDLLEQVDEDATIGEILNQLFVPPPQWANNEYTVDNLDVFVPTAAGGLARAPHSSTLKKVFSTKGVVLIDYIARLHIIPKQRVKEWLATWNKDAQSKQIKPSSLQ